MGTSRSSSLPGLSALNSQLSAFPIPRVSQLSNVSELDADEPQLIPTWSLSSQLSAFPIPRVSQLSNVSELDGDKPQLIPTWSLSSQLSTLNFQPSPSPA